jgi:hypothetical protein
LARKWKGAEFDRFDCVGQGIVRGEDHHGHVRMRRLEIAEYVEAVRIRKTKVEQHEVRAHFIDFLFSLRCRRADVDLVSVALEDTGESRLDGALVVDDDDGLTGIAHDLKRRRGSHTRVRR